jgi:hypothetical protein
MAVQSLRVLLHAVVTITHLARDSATLRRRSFLIKSETLATPAVLVLPLKNCEL